MKFNKPRQRSDLGISLKTNGREYHGIISSDTGDITFGQEMCVPACFGLSMQLLIQSSSPWNSSAARIVITWKSKLLHRIEEACLDVVPAHGETQASGESKSKFHAGYCTHDDRSTESHTDVSVLCSSHNRPGSLRAATSVEHRQPAPRVRRRSPGRSERDLGTEERHPEQNRRVP